jgi:hypothetical protein
MLGTRPVVPSILKLRVIWQCFDLRSCRMSHFVSSDFVSYSCHFSRRTRNRLRRCSWPAAIKQCASAVAHTHSVTVTEARAAPTEHCRAPFRVKPRSARYWGQTRNAELTLIAGHSVLRGHRPRAVEPPRDVSSVDYPEGTRLKVVST